MRTTITPSWIRVLALAVAALAVAGCGGSGVSTTVTPAPAPVQDPGPIPPPPPGPAVSGAVRMPNGQVASAHPTWLERLASLDAALALTGNVSPVGRDVEVHLALYRGDLQYLASTFTNDQGQFRFLLPSGADEHTCRFIVSVGDANAGTLTRAFVFSTSEPVDIDFASETVVRLIFDRVVNAGANVCCVSAAEIGDLVAAVRSAPGVISAADAAEINASAFAAVAALPSIQAMLDADLGPDCAPLVPVGDVTRCESDTDCPSGSCVGGICCPASCPADAPCVLGECTAPRSDGTSCTVAAQCQSGFCVDSACCQSSFCPSGQVCNAPENPGRCTIPLPSPTRPPTATPTVTPTLGPQRHVLEAATVTTEPGTQVSIAVTLHSTGLPVAGTQNDLTVDSIDTPIAAKADGKPDCAANPSIGKSPSSFAFEPPGCSGTACTSIRALVFSISDVQPIPDGSVLYTCTVDVAAAAAGSYPVTISGVVLSTPEGQQVPGATAIDGAILVGGATP